MTLVDLYRKALEKLQVAAAGEPVDAGDVQSVADKYAALYSMLLTKELVSWAATEDVPDNAVLPLISMLAYASAKDFERNPAEFIDGALDLNPIGMAERQLRAQVAKRYIPHPAQSEYF